MLIKEDFSQDEFLSTFRKKFVNFCEKAPVLLSFRVTAQTCFLTDVHGKDIQKFELDFSQDVKQNIRMIKDWLLENKYPVMFQIEEQEIDPDPDRINELTEAGISIDKAIMKASRREITTAWRIEKVIVKRDELFVRNMTTGRYYRFKMSMPSTIFLKRYREKLDPFESWDVFQSKSTLISELEEAERDE